MPSTDKKKIAPQSANHLGWRDLTVISGENHQGEPPVGETIFVFGHLSDLHICDAESPSRIEYLDRYSDPDSPWRDEIGYVGTYRAQEILTTQVVAAMVDSLNEIKVGPITGKPIDAVVVTGDMTDNAQRNETSWYLNVLNGGEVTAASGDKSASEWVGSTNVEFDSKYWHPDGESADGELDEPISKYGFPVVKGLVEAARKTFSSKGLEFPWFATYGNHDRLLQGTVAPTDELNELSIGNKRIVGLPEDYKIPEIKPSVGEVGPVWYPHNDKSPKIEITSDTRRAFNNASEFAQQHLKTGGHGFTDWNVETDRAYWSKELESVALVSLDTVNPWGGWQGSLDEEQLLWLDQKLNEFKNKYVLILSHHPSLTLINDYAPAGKPRRVLRDELFEVLDRHKNVIAWVAGHVHLHAYLMHERSDGSNFIEFTTASQIDWPQQGRIIEIVKERDSIAIASTVVDHEGKVEWQEQDLDYRTMAGISRSLSLNDWQRRDDFNPVHRREGENQARNVIWRVSDPF
jgi:metallophosphoesterase (TIGR03767 family)